MVPDIELVMPTQIGGTNENLKSIDQKGDVYTLVPRMYKKSHGIFTQRSISDPNPLYDKTC
jgi:tRNA (Thr-GGU) A37 N-methylase